MKKDFSNRKYITRRAPKKNRWGAVLFVAIMVLVVSGIGFVAYQYKKQGPVYEAITANIAKVTTWIAEHKSGLHKNLEKVKHLAANKNEAEEEPQIHFEFYTALPNMQVTASQAAPDNDDTKPVKSAPVKTAMTKTVISNAEDLEREFAKEIKK